MPSLGTAAAMVWLPGPVGQSLFAAAKLWLLALPLVWWLAVDRGRPSWSPPRRGGFLVGAASGLVMALAIAAAYLLLAPRLEPALLHHEIVEMGLDDPRFYLAGAAYWIFVNSVLEEYVYRWFVQRQAAALMPAWAAVLCAAAVFTAHHVVALSQYLSPGLNLLASTGIFLGGATWGWCYLRYRSIWPGWLSHACADVAIFAIGWHLVFG